VFLKRNYLRFKEGKNRQSHNNEIDFIFACAPKSHFNHCVVALIQIDDFSKTKLFDQVAVYPIVVCVDRRNSPIFSRKQYIISTDISPGINGFQFNNYWKCIFDNQRNKNLKINEKKVTITGSIDPYQLKYENIQYNKKLYKRPVIRNNPKIISPGKWALFNRPKIVIAGMAKRIEAYLDVDGAFAPGVNVYSVMFRILFYDKHLAGDYISINASLLKKLPIKVVSVDKQKKIIELAKEIQNCYGKDDYKNALRLENRVDCLFYELYEFTPEEIKIVEGGNKNTA